MILSSPCQTFTPKMINHRKCPPIDEHTDRVGATDHTNCQARLPRPAQRSRFLPHIKIVPPEVRFPEYSSCTRTKLRYPNTDDLDNDVFLSPTSSPTRLVHTPPNNSSDEKHEIYSGRLYLLQDRCSSSGTSTPSSPSSRSPTRSSSDSPHSPTRFGGPDYSMARFRVDSTHSPPRSPKRLSSPCHSPIRTYFNNGAGGLPSCSSFPLPSISSPTKCTNSPPRASNPSSPSGRRKLPVQVRVYRCNHDHFAVMTRDVVHTNKPVYVNLRHCRVMPGDSLGRFMLAGNCDSGNITEFEVPDLSTLEKWLDAFQPVTPPASPGRAIAGGPSLASPGTPSIPKTSALPTLAETDEEDG